MKIVSETIILQKGDWSTSEEFNKCMSEVNRAIESVVWAHSQKFIVNPVRKGNGVNPIKEKFVTYLSGEGWKTEESLSIDGLGPVDAAKATVSGLFAVEWETGNVSSSHRALNKMYLGIKQKKLLGGVLIMPVRELAKFLTDRIGNLEEIEPYFPIYDCSDIASGYMAVIGVTYDDVSVDVPLIPKGKDGNAKKEDETPLGL